MVKEFSRQLPRTNQTFELLPAFRVCDAFDARDFVRRSELIAPEGDGSWIKTNYLFYGRPVFRNEIEKKKSTDLSLYPVAFVLNTDILEEIIRLFPFSTQAMKDGVFADYFNRKLTYLDFELEGEIGRVRDLVMRFFDGNKDYLNPSPVPRKFEGSYFETKTLASLYADMMAVPAHQRLATV